LPSKNEKAKVKMQNDRAKMINPKHKIPNPKQYQITKIQMTKTV